VPSIEIICVGQLAPGDFGHLPFAVRSGTELKSHRSPKPLFQEDFAGLKGCIYHLGDPALKTRNTGGFVAFDLLSDRSRYADPPAILEFRAKRVPPMHELLESLMEASPVRRLLFTSDWQFGPELPYRSPPVTLAEFWSRHDSCSLRLNGAYPIHE